MKSQIRAILIDDEPDSLESLQFLLKRHCPDVEILASCKNGGEGLDQIREHAPNVIFLDIQMPGMSGFQMLEQLQSTEPHVIFTTAYDQYALDAIKVSAMDYVLKPVGKEELVAAVEKARRYIAQLEPSRQFEVLLTNIKGMDAGFQKLAIPTVDELTFVNISDIMYCQADGNYTSIVTKTGDKHVISRTLKDTAQLLKHPFFFRTHQSYLINLHCIMKYIRGAGGQVVLQDGTTVPVSRTRKEALLSLIYK